MLGTMPAHAPAHHSQTPTLNDPKVETLRQMFPEIEADVLASMLAFHQGSIEDAAVAILDVPNEAPTIEDTDAAMARALQEQMDIEVARTVQNDLDEEAKAAAAAAAAAHAREPTVRAAKAVESAASSTLSMLKKANPLAMLSGKRMGSSSNTHGTRLLDSAADPSDSPLNFTPLQVPDFVPSAFSAPAPHAAQSVPAAPATPSAAEMPDLSDQTEWGTAPLSAPTPPNPPHSSDSTAPGARYSSRVDRARAANYAANRIASTSSITSSPAPTAPLAAPAAPAAPFVPVGELI